MAERGLSRPERDGGLGDSEAQAWVAPGFGGSLGPAPGHSRGFRWRRVQKEVGDGQVEASLSRNVAFRGKNKS